LLYWFAFLLLDAPTLTAVYVRLLLTAETFKRSILAGAPSVVVRIYDALKYCFKKEDREKCVLCSPKKYHEVLSDNADLTVFPSVMVEGGKGTGRKGFPLGFSGGKFPWQD